MSKSYSLVLNSQVALNRDTSGGIGAYKYYVNWGGILPQEYTKFKMSFTFRTDIVPGSTPLNNIQIGASVGGGYCYDQTTSQSNYIGSVIPKAFPVETGAPEVYYEANELDNIAVMIGYPSNPYVTVSIKEFDGTAISDFAPYILQLNFTVLE